MSAQNPVQAFDRQHERSLGAQDMEDLLQERLGFLSTVSHEIRTPLNAIIGISDLLQKPTSPDQQEEYFQILKQTSESLLELVNNVLDFSKINSGKLKITNKIFDLRTTITRSLYGEKIKARSKNLDLRVVLDPLLPETIIGDSVKIGQVFMNLVSNAIKFTDEGKVEINVVVIALSDDNVRLRCSVSDTGIGIPEEQKENIFEAFHQGSEDINIRYAGTGLGLSISQKLIRLLGGQLEVVSKEGIGSEFSFCLDFPIGFCPEKELIQSLSKKKLSAKGIKLLLVEDNKINVLVAEKYLAHWEVEVDTSPDGHEALAKIQQKDYDIVLMDLQMPVMDGFTATRLIRELPDEKYQQLPIIALTAASEHYYQERIRLSGFNDFMNKPFHPEDLLKKIITYAKLDLLKKQVTESE